ASADSPGRQPCVRPHLSGRAEMVTQSGGPRVRHAGGHWWGSHVCGHGALWPSAYSGRLAGAHLPGPPASLLWARRLSARASEGWGHDAQPVACLLCSLQCRGAWDGTARSYGESSDHGNHYRKPGADLRRLLAHSAGHRAGLWRTDGHYPHEHGTCGADLYALTQLAALCRVCGTNRDLSDQLTLGLGLWPGGFRRDALDLPGDDSAGGPAMALERVAGQSALWRFCGAGGDVSDSQYPEISRRRIRATRHWPGPLCGHVQLPLGSACTAGPGVCRVCGPQRHALVPRLEGALD